MGDSYRLITLFGYECKGGRKSLLWDNPRYFMEVTGQGAKMLDEDFDEWKARKRAFKPEEIAHGQWVKVSDAGHPFLVRLHEDGTLAESALFDPNSSWPGTWRLTEEGFLRLSVGQYELDVVANRDSAIHSGIECKAEKGSPHAYFKVIHAR